jgi:hypothetical protein
MRQEAVIGIKHTKPPTCQPVYDNDGNVEYYVDCRSANCPGSDHYSAANAGR